MKPKQKLYCYVDETGQDVGSDYFIVVTAITHGSPDKFRELLFSLEADTKTGSKKWNKMRGAEREKFLSVYIQKHILGLYLFYGQFKKPLPYFFPILETIEKSLQKLNANKGAQVIVYIDGLDRQSAKKYTNALRSKHFFIRLAKGVRDESEPLIRLADRWVGCIRQSVNGNEDAARLVKRAIRKQLLMKI